MKSFFCDIYTSLRYIIQSISFPVGKLIFLSDFMIQEKIPNELLVLGPLWRHNWFDISFSTTSRL